MEIDKNINDVNKRIDQLKEALDVLENVSNELFDYIKRSPDSSDMVVMLREVEEFVNKKIDLISDESMYLFMSRDDLIESVDKEIEKAYDNLKDTWTPVIITAIS